MNLSDKKVMVTGASGFVGKNLVDKLNFELLTPTRHECDVTKEVSVRNTSRKINQKWSCTLQVESVVSWQTKHIPQSFSMTMR